MRSPRPTYFSPANRAWVSAPSIAHFNRALELEFEHVVAYEMATHRFDIAGECGLITGAFDCWVSGNDCEWLETFALDASELRGGNDWSVVAARKWCAVRGLAHKSVPKVTLANGTILRESRRRIIVGYNAQAYLARSVDVALCVLDLLQYLRSGGPCTVSQLLARSRGRVPAELANTAVCELVRTGKAEADLANRAYDGGSRLVLANTSQSQSR